MALHSYITVEQYSLVTGQFDCEKFHRDSASSVELLELFDVEDRNDERALIAVRRHETHSSLEAHDFDTSYEAYMERLCVYSVA